MQWLGFFIVVLLATLVFSCGIVVRKSENGARRNGVLGDVWVFEIECTFCLCAVHFGIIRDGFAAQATRSFTLLLMVLTALVWLYTFEGDFTRIHVWSSLCLCCPWAGDALRLDENNPTCRGSTEIPKRAVNVIYEYVQ